MAKKIIAIPLHYTYDPENPQLERKSSSLSTNLKWIIKCLNSHADNNDTTGLNMQPIGPHPVGSFETWVPIEYFAKLYAWFLQKRSPLAIFVHPLTRHELTDHTERVVFMGKSYVLKTDTLRELIPDFGSQYEFVGLGYANTTNPGAIWIITSQEFLDFTNDLIKLYFPIHSEWWFGNF